MCFNFTMTTPIDEAQRIYNLTKGSGFKYNNFKDFNSAFTHPFLPVILENRELDLAKWGLIPSWVRECKKAEDIVKYTLNARIETLTQKPSFKGSVEKGRVLILFDGFYEWRHEGGKKIPYYVSRADGKPLMSTGLLSTWSGINTFSLITTEAKGIMREVHNSKLRMPFFLDEEKMDIWLNSNIPFNDLVNEISPSYDLLTAIEKEPIR